MPVITLESVDQFDAYVKSKELSVVHFFAAWAAQCGLMNDVLDEMTKSNDYKGVKFAKIVAEDLPEIAEKYNITAVPTVLLMRSGSVAERVDGANPAALAAKIKEEMNEESSFSTGTTTSKPTATKDDSNKDLDERLTKLINQAPCMLFMKGNPANPKCGFSRTIVALLDSYKTDYETFDILNDNTVREGLKVFSKWPTYPQLYVRGELLGGLDIIVEMGESGELDEMLPKKAEKRS